MLFQARKTFIHLQNTNYNIFDEYFLCAKPPQNNNFIQQFFSSGSVSTAIHESNTKQNTWTEEHTDEWTRDRMLTIRDRTWSASVQTPTRNQNSRHECRDPNTTLKHKTRHVDERAHGSGTLEAVHSQKTWRECCPHSNPWMTPDQSDRTLTLTTYELRFVYKHELWYCRECTMENDPEEKKL